MSFNIKDNILKLRGRIEIVDKNGKTVLTEDNLVLMTTRLLILQLLFQDNFIGRINSTGLENPSNYIEPISPNGNIRRRICGFQLGNGGIKKESPYTPYVPSYDELSLAKPLQFLSLYANGSLISNEYDDLSQIINSPSIENGNICSNNTVKYFDRRDNQGNQNYYAKSFNDNDSRLYVSGSQISYKIKLDVEPQDLQGQSINELGLIIGDCTYGNNNIITKIENPQLATRVTFTTLDLSTTLLSSFSIYYTIFI